MMRVMHSKMRAFRLNSTPFILPPSACILAFHPSSFILVRAYLATLRASAASKMGFVRQFVRLSKFRIMKLPELFEFYEVERVPRWPLVSRLIGVSIGLHIIMLACAFYVPAVRNALNLASVFSDAGYVDKDYQKTQIADRAEIINLPKFQYPEGYFQPASMMMPAPDPFAPQIIASAPPVVMTPPVVTPAPPMMMPRTPKGRGLSPNPVPAPSASPSPSVDPKDPAQNAAAATDGKTIEQLEAEMNKIAATNNIERPNENEINKRPLRDWLANANALKTNGKLDLNKTMEVVIVAELDPNGKLVNPVVVQKSGDEVLIEVAKEMVGAINDSNALSFLKKLNQTGLNGKQVRFTVKLDQSDVVAKVESEVESEQRAKEIASGFNFLLMLGQQAKKGQDEELIYKNTKISSTGNQIIVNFTMPRQVAGEMVKKQLPPAT